jgi:hypothetical protein
MVNELEPMLANVLLAKLFTPSIAVRIPTKAIIPIEIISAVRTVRNLFALIDCIPILIVSMAFIRMNYSSKIKKSRPIKTGTHKNITSIF